MKKLQTILLLFFSSILYGQDLSGTWEGSGGMGAPYLKLVIVKCGNDYVGYTYDSGGMGFCKANFLGNYDPSSQKLKGKGMGFIASSFGHGQGSYILSYSSSGAVDYLRGTARPRSGVGKVLTLGIPNTVSLKRTSRNVDTTNYIATCLTNKTSVDTIDVEDSLLQVVSVENKLEEKMLATRKERMDDTLSVIAVSDRKLLLKIFDNGITDGDSVSILYNNKLIAANIRVSAKTTEIPLELDENTIHHRITLVAHNLGSISPNTATVVIEWGNKKQSLSASSDLKRNASIILQFDPKE